MPASRSLAVTVLHANPVIQAGLVAILSRIDDVEVDDVAERAHLARVVVTDYRAGLSMVSTLRSDGHRQDGPRVVVFTALCSGHHVRVGIEQGIDGYVLLDCDESEVVRAVREVAMGNRYLCAQASQRVADLLIQGTLTRRELEVLERVARGDANKVIARELSIALGTVKAHVKSTLDKLGATSRTHAVTTAQKRGLLGDGLIAAALA